jgi:predicted peptidase
LHKTSRGMVAICLWLALASMTARSGSVSTGFLDRSVVLDGTTYKFQVFVPAEWTAAKTWPVIVALHGTGEAGEDGMAQTDTGIASAIRRYRERFPVIVLMPQARVGLLWSEPKMRDLVIAALSSTTREFHGDPRRTYLTGLSLGGHGTWMLAGEFKNRFAALVPVCGRIVAPGNDTKPDDLQPYAAVAQKIGPAVPVWIFHGGDDPIVPVIESRRMFEAMKALGGEVRYTEYAGVGHESWVTAYADPALIPWLLSKFLSANP